MINEILAFWTPGALELIIICFISFVVFVIPVALVIFIVVYLVQNNKEKQKLRMEVEKLAEDINHIVSSVLIA